VTAVENPVKAAENPIPGSVLAKLMAVVRAEFRAEVYVPAPNDPVFISDQCIVADCDRTAETLKQRLCCAHWQRFRKHAGIEAGCAASTAAIGSAPGSPTCPPGRPPI
jgi:hypothetical protein